MCLFQDFKGLSILRVIWGVFIVGNTHRALFLYRLSSWFQNHKLSPIATAVWSLNVALHSCDISPKANIGPGITIFHSVGIVIGDVVIGKNLHIFQNVTVGSFECSDQHIGDDVTLSSGCCILASLGSNVTVGANAVVLKEVPSDFTAVGVPARLIEKSAV